MVSYANRWACPLIVALLLACGTEGSPGRSDASSSREAASAALPAPPYDIVETEDVSFQSVKRLNLRVALPSHYLRDAMEQVARAIASDVSGREPVNAISMMFYSPGAATSGQWDVGMVEWAPNGEWGQASSVTAGDYSSFEFRVRHNAPLNRPAPEVGLARADGSGLLGVPLPVGAVLVERGRGAGEDLLERYEIKASQSEIRAFFQQEMIRAGWKRDVSLGVSQLYSKGALLIAVTPEAGGGFNLIGS